MIFNIENRTELNAKIIQKVIEIQGIEIPPDSISGNCLYFLPFNP
jgi:hypothetical protein